MILKLINNENTYEFNVTDLNEGVKLYYHFEIPTVDIPDGKYNMQLLDGETVIYEDIVCIGDFKGATIQYKRGENIYINAPLDGKFEDVTVEITATQTTVYPNDGFDAMTSVVIDATPVYDDGYNTGNADGYNTGKQDGIEIGYNSGYTDGETVGYNSGLEIGKEIGVNQAGEIIAETARVLDITENGSYVSQYSDTIYPDITGVYPDGENFYSYAQLKNNKYITGLIPRTNTKLDFWFKPNKNQNGYVIGAQKPYTANSVFKIIINKNVMETELGGTRVDLQNITNKWYHIEMSYADGLVVNGEKIGDYTANILGTYNIPFGINFLNDVSDEPSQSNGNFGMIKITTDGITNVIIPTAEGLKNITTDEILQEVQVGDYVFTEKLPIIPEGNLIKTVNVNVQPKIDVAENGIKFGYSIFEKVPDFYDFSNVTNMIDMFSHCVFETIPKINTSNAEYMDSMFSYCKYLTTIPQLDTSNVRSMNTMFNECSELQTIPELDTSNVTTMTDMFSRCLLLTSIPALQTGKLNMYSYQGIFGYYELPKLINLGGFLNLKVNLTSDNTFKRLPNLTYESCINVLNGLADVTELGGRTLKVHQNFLTTVGNEISIGTSKGWTITA